MSMPTQILSPNTVVHSFDYKKNVLSLLDGIANKVSFTFRYEIKTVSVGLSR